MGHIVPDLQYVVDHGLHGMVQDLDKRANESSGEKASFYISARDSIRGIQNYLTNWMEIADAAYHETPDHADKVNMSEVKHRLMCIVGDPPKTFHEAVQLIFTFHTCLHLVGELTAMGRIDQILWPFLERDLEADTITIDRAQEIIDCLWVKLGENAFVNRAFIYDYRSYGTTSINGLGGNFPQGGGINQWVQQVTVGGYKATDGETPEGGANPVTLLCLKAARRIPVNAPCLSLRTYKGMPQEYIDEAATSILSGGAHPILYNDDKLCKGLLQSGGGITVPWSRDYAADGCFEPMMAGASEFTFGNVEPMAALEQTLNQGSTYGMAGSVHLRGLKQATRCVPAAQITSFQKLQDVFLEQFTWLVNRSYSTILNAYGNFEGICPSPLLSAVLQGCVDSGRDLTAGGAKFHMGAYFSPFLFFLPVTFLCFHIPLN